MGLLSKIKSDVKKSGQNKGKFIYFKEGAKQRVRFLHDMDDGMEVVFHDSFEKGINVPCQEIFDRDCPYCEKEDLRTRSQYVWSVYNYEAKEVQLFMFAVNNFTPVPALIAFYENYGTLMDRDYVISTTGRGMSKSFAVIPMDKVKFRNTEAKPYSEDAVLKMIDKAFPSDETEDDEEETPKRKPTTNKKNKAKTKSKPKDEELEDDEDFDEEEEWEDESDEDEIDYSDLSPQELYKLCKERDINVQPRKTAKYYIRQLEEYDQAQDDWGDEEDEYDDDEWEDE